ncbi:MAG: hypothetical protein K2J86_08340, partial [Prevotella sp.]|nr:hypothetical protein [Prevotella sp.]
NMVGIVGDIESDKIQGITKISSLKMSIRPIILLYRTQVIVLFLPMSYNYDGMGISKQWVVIVEKCFNIEKY